MTAHRFVDPTTGRFVRARSRPPRLQWVRRAIDTAPDGTAATPTVLDFGGATFREDNTILIRDRAHLTIRNVGVWTDVHGDSLPPYQDGEHLWPRSRMMFRVDNSTGIRFENVTIRSSNADAAVGNSDSFVHAREAQHGIGFHNSADVAVVNCHISHVWGDCIYLNDVDRTLIDGCLLERTGRMGIAIVRGTDATFRNNAFRHMRYSPIDVEPNTTSDVIDNILIEDNTMGATRLIHLPAGGPGAQVSNVTFRRNTMQTRSGVPVVYVNGHSTDAKRENWTFVDNRFVVGGSTQFAFRFFKVRNLTFRGNVADFGTNNAPDRTPGLDLRDCETVDIDSNTFLGINPAPNVLVRVGTDGRTVDHFSYPGITVGPFT